MSVTDLPREERTARLADLRAREAARKVVLRGTPLLELPLVDRIAFVIYDPGAIVPRGDNYGEPLYRWQARAIQYVLDEQLAAATAGCELAIDGLHGEAAAMRQMIRDRDGQLAQLRAESATEWGVRADGCVTRHTDEATAWASVREQRTAGTYAVVVSRTVHHSAWTEGTS